MYSVDLNCDLGESFGAYKMGSDEQILPLITSANIACGYHAGDPGMMRQTVKLAMEHGIAVGAHPGPPDLIGFGRRNMDVSPQEVYDMTVYQIGALDAFVRSEGGTMQHVKPHGALYNMAAQNAGLADAIAESVYKVNPELVLFGLSGSELIRAGRRIGLRTASEVFADRTYQQDGDPDSPAAPDALIHDPELAAGRIIRMVKEGTVRSQQGIDVPIAADTICIHGDGEHALPFARRIKQPLIDEGVAVQPVRNSI
ncbi:LamB/YcsF family protein [Paenibacillus sp. P26]|nr:LamB/YcsF family protein [Paenibacillus sp. P26]